MRISVRSPRPTRDNCVDRKKALRANGELDIV